MPTIRQQIIELLSSGERGSRELSRILGIREKEVLDHLPHIARSVGAGKGKLVIHPPVCLSCGFEFKERRRFTKPGRCPKCKSQQIQPPGFEIP